MSDMVSLVVSMTQELGNRIDLIKRTQTEIAVDRKDNVDISLKKIGGAGDFRLWRKYHIEGLQHEILRSDFSNISGTANGINVIFARLVSFL